MPPPVPDNVNGRQGVDNKQTVNRTNLGDSSHRGGRLILGTVRAALAGPRLCRTEQATGFFGNSAGLSKPTGIPSSSSSSSLTSAKDSTLAGSVLFSLSHHSVDIEDIIVYVQCGYKNLRIAGSVLLFSVSHRTVDIENTYYTYSVVTRSFFFLSPTTLLTLRIQLLNVQCGYNILFSESHEHR